MYYDATLKLKLSDSLQSQGNTGCKETGFSGKPI